MQASSNPLAFAGPRGTTTCAQTRHTALRSPAEHGRVIQSERRHSYLEPRSVGEVRLRALRVVDGPVAHGAARAAHGEPATVPSASAAVAVFGRFVHQLKLV